MWWNNIEKEKGAALYFAILITALLVGISFGVGSIFVEQIKSVRGIGHSIAALYAAEAGFERILFEDFDTADSTSILNCDGTMTAPSFCSTNFLNGATYDVVVEPPGGGCSGALYCVETTGTFQKASRKIKIER